jgi:hypothetical protein
MAAEQVVCLMIGVTTVVVGLVIVTYQRDKTNVKAAIGYATRMYDEIRYDRDDCDDANLVCNLARRYGDVKSALGYKDELISSLKRDRELWKADLASLEAVNQQLRDKSSGQNPVNQHPVIQYREKVQSVIDRLNEIRDDCDVLDGHDPFDPF